MFDLFKFIRWMKYSECDAGPVRVLCNSLPKSYSLLGCQCFYGVHRIIKNRQGLLTSPNLANRRREGRRPHAIHIPFECAAIVCSHFIDTRFRHVHCLRRCWAYLSIYCGHIFFFESHFAIIAWICMHYSRFSLFSRPFAAPSYPRHCPLNNQSSLNERINISVQWFTFRF